MSEMLIQWPRAKYWEKCWNPIIGCLPCSPACEHCYAQAWAKRFGQSFEPHPSKDALPPRRGVVFCGNMTDLFADFVTVGESVRFIHQAAHGNGEYLWLTKRPDNMCERLRRVFAKGWLRRLPGHWFGFTAEDQMRYSTRIHDFRYGMPIFIAGWLSAEPLLGPIDLGLRYIAPEDQPLEWVVVGCESGPNRRPCKIEWVESIVEQCRAADVPVFVKQLDIGGRCETDINRFPAHLRIRQVPWAKEGDSGMTATATTRHLQRGDGATAPVGLTGRPPLILGEKTPPRTATATPVKPNPGHSGISSTTAQAVPRKRGKTGVPGDGASGRSAQGPQKLANCAWRGTRPTTSHETGEGKARRRNGRAPSGPEGAILQKEGE